MVNMPAFKRVHEANSSEFNSGIVAFNCNTTILEVDGAGVAFTRNSDINALHKTTLLFIGYSASHKVFTWVN